MSDAMNKKLDLIRNLLEVAAHPGTSVEEAENATAKAFALMTKYGIDEETARKSGTDTSTEQMIMTSVDLSGIYAPVYQVFAYRIGTVVVGVAPLVYGKGRKCGFIYAGIESSVRYAEILFHSLRTQCNTALAEAFGKLPIEERGRMTAMEAFKWRRSFIEAFGLRVSVRLAENARKQAAEAEMSAPGTEVALVDRQQRANAWLESEVDITHTKGSRMTHNYDGAVSGRAAGNAANLGGMSVNHGAGGTAIGR